MHNRKAVAATGSAAWLYRALPVVRGLAAAPSRSSSSSSGRAGNTGTQHPAPQRSPHRCLASSGSAAPEPWTPDDLDAMAAQLEGEAEQALGNEWRRLFTSDPDVLYEYADRDEAEWTKVLDELEKLPKSQWEDSELLLDSVSFSPALCNQFIGMGTWRLRHATHPLVNFLAARVEGTWREAFVDDLCLYPPSKWKDAFDICDSMDPGQELGGWSYADVPFPEKGEPGYPRLLIENRVYSSRVFRKLHLEVALRQDGLQVLHVVMYPRYAVDLPILALDLVMANGVVTLAVADACPVRKGLQLPAHYLQTMQELQGRYLPDEDGATNRRIPDWGAAIFSPAAVCIRPDSAAHLAGFMAYTVALTRAHCLLATLVMPLNLDDPRQRRRAAELLDGHKSFVDNQLANKKTSRVLEVAFGAEWTERYMRDMMFDFTPGDEPPVEDGSLTALFNYYEEQPELGTRPAEWDAVHSKVAVERAEEVLSSLAMGEDVRQENLEKALQALYTHDPEFRANCMLLLPELATCSDEDVGALLAEQLEELGLGSTIKRWVDQGPPLTASAAASSGGDDE